MCLRRHPHYEVEITKTSEDDFQETKYKGVRIDTIRRVVQVNHPESNVGTLKFGKHVSIRNTIILDLVGDITIGDYVIFSHFCKILTHDHQIKSREIILSQDEKLGVKWSSIEIGNDVYFGMNSIVAEKVTHIPDGFVFGANSVLTKNPGAYEIWAGSPAKKIGVRE